MKMTDRDLNLMAGITEYQFMELKENIDKIKTILNLKIEKVAENTSYYITVSGSHRIIIIHDDFTHIANYNKIQENNAYNKITQLDFKFIFKNEDNLTIEIDDYNSIERFLINQKFINNFNDLQGRLAHKAVLVLYQKM